MPDLARMIAQQGSDLQMRQAIATSIPAGGTCTIRFGDLASTTGADDITGVRILASAAVANGDTVWVLATGGALLIIGSQTPAYPAKFQRSANYNHAAGGSAKVPLDLVVWDPNSRVDTANNRYLCAADGMYTVYGHLLAELNNNPQRFFITARKNGVEDQHTVFGSGYYVRGGAAGDLWQLTVAGEVRCSAGDYLELWFSNSGPAVTVVEGGSVAAVPWAANMTVRRTAGLPT